MYMKKLLCILLFYFVLGAVHAQTRFFSAVNIRFEKTVYTRQLYKEIDPGFYERGGNLIPETTVSYFDFTGDTARSVYRSAKEIAPAAPSSFSDFTTNNVVYNDYTTGTTITQKPVFEETYLVQDSLLSIKWKITADTRNIAGFECRKAIGVVNDSVTVFAFYTDEILINAGPEGANGLPGMILGMGIPRIHTTWFATKMDDKGVNLKNVVPATKGKKSTGKQ
jgi:GLPGLI family protein